MVALKDMATGTVPAHSHGWGEALPRMSLVHRPQEAGETHTLAACASLSFLIEGGQRSLGPRPWVLCRRMHAGAQHTGHGYPSWPAEGTDSFLYLQMLCFPAATLSLYCDASRGLADEHTVSGQKAFSLHPRMAPRVPHPTG